MNDDTTWDLLEAMAPHVSPSDPAVVAGRREVGKQIAGARRTRVLRWAAPAGAAASLAIVLAVWPGGAENALASWVPVPTTPHATQVEATQHACDRAMSTAIAQLAKTQRSSGVHLPDAPTSEHELAGRAVLLAEQRGDVIFVLSANTGWTVGCLGAPGVSTTLTEATPSDLSHRVAPPAETGVDVLSSADEGDASDTHATLVWGRAGASVEQVHVTTVDGTTISATVDGGYWSAWWPTNNPDHSSDATVAVTLDDGSTRAGGTIRHLDARVSRP